MIPWKQSTRRPRSDTGDGCDEDMSRYLAVSTLIALVSGAAMGVSSWIMAGKANPWGRTYILLSRDGVTERREIRPGQEVPAGFDKVVGPLEGPEIVALGRFDRELESVRAGVAGVGVSFLVLLLMPIPFRVLHRGRR